MAQKTYDLVAPEGTKVTVEGAERRDTLLARGFTEADKSSTRGSGAGTEKNK